MYSYLNIDDTDGVRSPLTDWFAHGAEIAEKVNNLLARIEEIEARQPFGTDAAGQQGEASYRSGADGYSSPARAFGLQDIGPWLSGMAFTAMYGMDGYTTTEVVSRERMGG